MTQQTDTVNSISNNLKIVNFYTLLPKISDKKPFIFYIIFCQNMKKSQTKGENTMKTPLEYTKNLKNHIITPQMLLDCLYSSNKRAKNWRDKEQEYREFYRSSRYSYDKYDNEAKAREKKLKYYKQKEIMLSVLQPVCIHRECIGYERHRIYDYEKDYIKYKNEFVWENRFWSDELNRFVYFGDIELRENPKYHYYLFYSIGSDLAHTFHTPISEDDVKKYNLDIVDIDTLYTEGHDIHDLISNQFVTKVVTLIESGNYMYILNAPKH